ncbi:ABC transporter permease [Serinibacter arcticus]|uniref:ABC transporter permease n=1 Tax=Serinibacter arcticus TaxID=1655435 RepID=A0A2U1ZXI5_9MICO|nr:ABC transporter permease subunit [Serinibacter arcticus]PWD51696.1 ABC transporter permease [Serinibacter arcticus]
MSTETRSGEVAAAAAADGVGDGGGAGGASGVTPAARVPSTRPRRPLPPWAVGVLGGVGIIAVWWLLAATVLSSVGAAGVQAIPTPPQVIAAFGDAGWAYFWRNFSVTLTEAGTGYLWGNALALVLSGLVLVLPRLEGLITQLAIITYCIPIVAVAVLAVVLIPPPGRGEPSGTAVLLAALSVFFTTVVGALLGLKSADASALDLVAVYGGSRFTQLVKVRLIAALPAILNALQIAVPAAFLGAVLAGFFGKVESGVGMAMMLAMQNSDAPRIWALALASGAVALLGFVAIGLVARLVAPWSKGASS